MTNSKGDPRVLFVMNLVLSTVFAAAVVWGLAFIGAVEFGWRNVGIVAIALMVVTSLIVR
ncbi:hypothetical protein NGM10_08865 [Halorussus salilacus]|uniref:hypothetical protein n=1 Tax=Halorussus salilacus TaxID=2953750 RepID=UPI0020A1BB18|nr:hypothetical protein [Halorussus salilacus]USZ66842.1 hypothetical protein NGM10_08865 [Halorussus salilacus]